MASFSYNFWDALALIPFLQNILCVYVFSAGTGNRTQETFQASFYMMVVDDRYIPYGMSHRGEPPCQIRMLADPIARCAYRFLVHHNIRPKVRVVEL